MEFKWSPWVSVFFICPKSSIQLLSLHSISSKVGHYWAASKSSETLLVGGCVYMVRATKRRLITWLKTGCHGDNRFQTSLLRTNDTDLLLCRVTLFHLLGLPYKILWQIISALVTKQLGLHYYLNYFLWGFLL